MSGPRESGFGDAKRRGGLGGGVTWFVFLTRSVPQDLGSVPYPFTAPPHTEGSSDGATIMLLFACVCTSNGGRVRGNIIID